MLKLDSFLSHSITISRNSVTASYENPDRPGTVMFPRTVHAAYGHTNKDLNGLPSRTNLASVLYKLIRYQNSVSKILNTISRTLPS